METLKHEHEEHEKHPHHPHHHHRVKITINSKPEEVPPGRLAVAEIKKLGKIPAADEVEEIIHGKLTPLPDDGHVEIKGGEVFISHPRDSGSS